MSKVIYKKKKTYISLSYDRHQENSDLQEENESSRQDDPIYEDSKSV